MIQRRVLLQQAAAALAVMAVPRARAQAISKVAWISAAPASDGAIFLEELRTGLRSLGYVEGRNLQLQAFWGDYSPTTLDRLAEEATASRPHVVVSGGNAVFSMRKYGSTVPIVFGYSGDPVLAGLVQSMARPGGNVTGMTYMTLELVGKRMQLLKEAVPHARRIAVISSPQHPGDAAERRVSEVAAGTVGLALDFIEIRSTAELSAALTQLESRRPDALMLFPTQTVMANRERIAEWSIRNRIPAASGWAQFAESGNFMSFGPSLRAANQRLAYFVDRILKGAKPADLPVEQPLVIEFVINMKTARDIGVGVPKALLLRADRVIE